ncbi:hypothetical protein KAT08_00860 [Candidatus Babeliales bacterium]|nr:hypothetical protein [Candidatus Babeliales bacterium]
MIKKFFGIKKHFIFVVIIFVFFFEIFAASKKPKSFIKKSVPKRFMLKGSVIGSDDWKNIPQFRVFFNGRSIISDEEGFYSFPLDKKIDKVKFLICKNIDQNFDNINTIESLKVKIEKPYKYVSLKLTGTNNNTWFQKEKNLKKKKFIIPQDCVIFLINPKYVDKIEKWDVKLEDNFIKLPQIVLKDSFGEKKIKREAAKSLLRTLDANLFHKNEEVVKKEEKSNIRISVIR